MLDASIVMPTYNRIDALALSLEGFKHQDLNNFEIIIADDGSKQDTKNFIDDVKKNYPLPIKHVWQEDLGFQKARISNMAIAKADSDYIIFNDADCIPRRDFVRAHLERRKKGHYLVGRTVKMSEKFSKKINASFVADGKLNGFNISLFLDYLFGNSKFFEYSVYIRSDILLDFVLRFRKNKNLFGYNFSAWKDDLIKVNGFNENFVLPNNEDGELGFRLDNAGVKHRFVIGRGISFHYYHDRSHATRFAENVERATNARTSGIVRCENGLDKHL